MSADRDEFLHRQNVARYERLLADETDPKKRETLTRLLAEEAHRAKAAGWPPRFR